ncbi:nitrate reductase [Rhodococcus sp. BP-349]|uniref:molybdopterin oxidoreductase family protein n=1 Tax=unclassified Rhodococcus (in: high G+C Gram-positive bacteria) TaxID=192944 RepID=UPI001C9B76BA|nr:MULTISPECIES: nitrate reductase [unclassified Rhodococcus (in: high G+C Gram-positive bacteria)]MBY6538860.1 nitrate reductase [Rhodococcus sp. BP-363]MBY6543197.1 nitrate reductase [Rhodococcus sp. BP-369]MBY6562427.1 nitrate reductase [Rhodococcus sp. BP-370]MBY6576719.1 nitrate reductase [Rhodococcus sp. BP-364]MBY6586020.1 nitrate reductase [Rhodococcus sp. BP-358]
MSDDRIANPWGERTPYAAGDQWPRRVDQHFADGVDASDVEKWVPSASILHSNGDAMDIAVRDGRIIGVRGRADDRVNHGRLGPKDLFGWQANASPDRLTRPLVRVNGALVESDWDSAMSRVVDTSQRLLRDHGPRSIGFYTSGQLFSEEYYTLGAIAHGAIGTNHVDGNTRLCTATAAEALKESFGSDGQPGSYEDVDHADVIALFGHNVAATQTVLWSRMLDRLAGSDPPRLLCVDPRTTEVARAATVHLAPVPGTNVALMNGLLHHIVDRGLVDHDYVDAHSVGYDDLCTGVREYTPERAAQICGVDAHDIRRGAELLGSATRLLSTVLQGFYQSHQATAAAVQVNNLHIVRGMLGRPGCGVLQMNGQPTAENTRECGADGDLAGFRNWSNDDHVADLSALWNLDMHSIPHYSPPTHAMQIFRYAEQGSIRMLWISATNPAVSLPELRRIRSILGQERLFVVVQDLYRTETTDLADVVLPAATWGEKTGTFTNADRTVHISDKAVEPPGEARADLDIFLDYARRMDFRDRDGAPFPQWHDPASAFEAWKRCSAGRPCDYTGITYDMLRERGGIQWPCSESAPSGTARLYTDGQFFAHPDYCESYGKDLVTGAPTDPSQYRATNPDGKAMIKAAPFIPPHEPPSTDYPFALITGRTVYHFHTRTKTGRVPRLQDAAPEVWVEMCATDADRLDVHEGEWVRICSPRGVVRARVRVTDNREGVLFVPFHYGYWDRDDADVDEHDRAANEMTITDWDPVSKQPLFKTSAARVEKETS